MNVLIVDDDRFVVSSIEKRVDWKTLGIEDVYTANNIRQAKKVFIENKVHVLISDIEMPLGSGLELLAWIRTEGYDVQAIFLTNFANFNYAQKAIELQSFEYYLKPIEIDKLELILKKAIQKAQRRQTSEETLRVGHYWQQNKQKLLDHFWISTLRNNEFLTRDQLTEQLKIHTLDYTLDTHLLPILLELFPYSLNMNREIVSAFDRAGNLQDRLTDINKQIFKDSPFSFESVMEINTNKEKFLVILKCRNLPAIHSLHKAKLLCNHLLTTIQEELACDVQCSISSIATLSNMHLHTMELISMKENVISYKNQVIDFPFSPMKRQNYIEPNLQALDDYLQSGNRVGFINLCQKYLTNLLKTNSLSLDVLSNFRLDVTQLIYTHLKRKEILAHKLFHGNSSHILQTQSSRSMEDIIEYITYLIDVSLEYMSFIHSQKSVVKVICEFIDENYHENITRESIAKIVYLSPDYIARIFKKEKGLSLVHYIIKKRVDAAKHLLLTTNLPVHTISDRVGYGNYSYFTKIFKKETNYTPFEFRKRSVII